MQLLFLKHFPGMTPEFVEFGPRKPNGELGDGMPWDWWEAGKAPTEAIRRPSD